MDGKPRSSVCYLCDRPINYGAHYCDSRVENIAIHDSCRVKAIVDASDTLAVLRGQGDVYATLFDVRQWYIDTYHLPQVRA